MSKKPKKRIDGDWLAILLYILLIAAAIGIWLVDIFVLGHKPTDNLSKMLILLAGIALSLGKRITSRMKTARKIEQVYTNEIGDAFEGKPGAKKQLLAALADYNRNDTKACLDKLASLYEKASTAKEREVIWLFRALCHEEAGRKEEAADVYRTLLDENPAHSTAWSNLSLLYRDLGEMKEAKAAAAEAIACNPGNAFAHHNLASLHFRDLEWKEAETGALRALEIQPGMRQAASLLAMIYTAKGDEEKAKTYTGIAVSAGEDAKKLADAAEIWARNYRSIAGYREKTEAWKTLTGIPAIRIHLDGKDSKSVVGGSLNEAPPVSGDGTGMRLLAAIFCSELPANTLLPDRGVLRFYIKPDDCYGADFDNLPAGDFCVLYDENEDAFTTDTAAAGGEVFPVNGGWRVRFEAITDPLSSMDYRFEDRRAELVDEHPEIDFEEADDEDEFEEEVCGDGHKLGGYPYFTQWDPRGSKAEYEVYDTLLLQLTSDYDRDGERVMFGDAGVCNFFIPAEKLKARDFSDILYTWDCG